ncbi:hypothetical protein BC940DRAFT_296091 [Gongronella butleri]|nr:hypothetical protein BC940DRAFT_296091 [Gongronella butleri]
MPYFSLRRVVGGKQGRGDGDATRQPLLSGSATHGDYGARGSVSPSSPPLSSLLGSARGGAGTTPATTPPAHVSNSISSDNMDYFYRHDQENDKDESSADLNALAQPLTLPWQRMVSFCLSIVFCGQMVSTIALLTSAPASLAYAWISQTLQPLMTITWAFLLVMWHQQHADRRAAYLVGPCTEWKTLVFVVFLFSIVPLIGLLTSMADSMALPSVAYGLTLVSVVFAVFVASSARQALLSQQQYTLWLKQRLQLHHSRTRRVVQRAAAAHAEVQESATMIMATLEQCTPIHTLAASHLQERLSACTTSLPMASLSAIRTHIHQLQHLRNHHDLIDTSVTTAPFDVGDLLQSVGDAMAGIAAKLDVNVVLYHADNNMHHARVLGNEPGLRHALFSLVQPLLDSCTPGASIELGLNIRPSSSADHEQSTEPRMHIQMEIIHTMSPAIPDQVLLSGAAPAVLTPDKMQQTVNSCLEGVDAKLSMRQLSPQKLRVDFGVTLPWIDAFDGHHPPMHKECRLEPSLKELTHFVGQLKGARMILHAREQSLFAKHITGCLASWNCDISHVPIDQEMINDASSSASSVSVASNGATPSSEHSSSLGVTPTQEDTTPNHDRKRAHQPLSSSSTSNNHNHHHHHHNNNNNVPSPAIEEEHLLALPPAFVLIDDHIPTLDNVLNELRTKSTTHQPTMASPGSTTTSRRQHQPQHKKHHHLPHHYMPLHHHYSHANHHPQQQHQQHQQQQHNHHRTHSNNQNNHNNRSAIVFFTSLSNYKRVRQTIHCALACTGMAIPRIVVVPKPAGPKRYLTAFHTAWYNVALHQPHFMPIATSPASPLFHMMAPMQYQSPSPLGMPLDGSTNNNDLQNLVYGPSPAPPTTLTPPTPDRQPLQDHYFHAQHPPSTRTTRRPVTFGTTTTANPNTLSTSPHFHHHEPGMHYFDHPPPMPSATQGQKTPSSTSTAASQGTTTARRASQQHTDMDYHANDQDASLMNENDTTPVAPTTTASPMDDAKDSAAPVVVTPPTNDAGGQKSRIKLYKRRKKVHGSAFANTVSPPINVLIVEDNMINQAILSAWMKKHKIKFSVAGNGQEAVEKWKAGGFHLILMDIQLPVMSGIDATKIIRSIEKEKKIGVLPMSSSFLQRQLDIESGQAMDAAAETTTVVPAPVDASITTEEDVLDGTAMMMMPSTFRSPVIIVALTASSLESDRHAALAAGCNDFLTKPVSLEWLEKKIIEWGCMQALIDFEGWRRWKRSNDQQKVQQEQQEQRATATSSTSTQQHGKTRKREKEKMETERKKG